MTTAEPLSVLRTRTSEKWTTYGPRVLPMFVAEMDYPLAPAVRDALALALERGDTGYVSPTGTGAAEAFASYAEDVWGWSPSVHRMSPGTDVSVVIVESLRRLVTAGQGVIVTPPVYPPFFDLVPEAGGTVVQVPLTAAGLDLAGIDRALAAGARGVLLCNPHNPLGLVFGAGELAELSRIVARHDGFVVSDEIHAPLTHHGQRFTPYLTVSDEARAHGLAAVSGSKAFNLAGLKCAFFVAESERMTSVVRSLPEETLFRTGLLGMIATQAGFTSGRDWLHGTVTAIEQNFTLLENQLRSRLPAVTFARPAASYLAWLDMSALGWGDDPARTALERGDLALSPGRLYGSQGLGHARMNLACAPETVIEAVDRLCRV
ncbi:aminotransferase class I/II-fold pyridoxal phosphate-dependent enzyme [Kineosporia sp. J2-2]|uniref:cysteine-S-conjugate beta-lyase n=1 Tax=Kineosporia corallincola TaxID=2835133 RepID=A0ABS5TCB1_9ACTN|nr:aminotransferase class I/II-fold pyridoxal phosphate-dependent enzyme [Kineosporia corallincola]MBT0768723.1 aminotransferase class I/II-fold pyridoxal phosphate-dependent enzyme [Kineosporia corallincola]